MADQPLPSLLPCPFCGEAATEWSHRIDREGDGCTVFVVGCRFKHATVTVQAAVAGPWGYHREGDPPSNDAARAMAIAAWNTRA